MLRFLRQFLTGIRICYAGALCFAARLVLLRAKTTSHDSNCRYEKMRVPILSVIPLHSEMQTYAVRPRSDKRCFDLISNVQPSVGCGTASRMQSVTRFDYGKASQPLTLCRSAFTIQLATCRGVRTGVLTLSMHVSGLGCCLCRSYHLGNWFCHYDPSQYDGPKR